MLIILEIYEPLKLRFPILTRDALLTASSASINLVRLAGSINRLITVKSKGNVCFLLFLAVVTWKLLQRCQWCEKELLRAT